MFSASLLNGTSEPFQVEQEREEVSKEVLR